MKFFLMLKYSKNCQTWLSIHQAKVKTCDSWINKHVNVNLIITFLFLKIEISWKISKKGGFENLKVPNHDFSTKSVPD